MMGMNPNCGCQICWLQIVDMFIGNHRKAMDLGCHISARRSHVFEVSYIIFFVWIQKKECEVLPEANEEFEVDLLPIEQHILLQHCGPTRCGNLLNSC